MERYKLNAVTRTAKGRQVRRENLVPAVLYGQHIEPMHLSVPEAEINHFVNHGSANALIDLTVGQDSHTVMLKDLQRNKIKASIMHIDFYAVNLSQKLTTTVPIHLVGEAVGVKAGGVMQHQAREIEVKCLPTEIPQGFHLDISAMDIGDSKTVADLAFTGDIEVLTPETEVIVSVLAPRLADEEETETTEAEAAEPSEEAETE